MAMMRRISPRADAARTTSPHGADVVSLRSDPATPAPALRAAAGYRVDGPDGRIGTLRGVVPADPAAPPEQLLVAFGLFIVTTAPIAVAEVRSVDVERRRILVATSPRPHRRRPAELARVVRRFVRTAAARAANDETREHSGRQR